MLRSFLQLKHLVPIFSLFVLAGTKSVIETSHWFAILASAFLGVSVMTSVYHAEQIAHKIGEGLGTIVLALSVTVIEVGLIISLMGKGGPDTTYLARDTVFAAVMIVTNGIVGLCLILGGMRFKEQEFQVQGSKSLLVVLIALSVLVFILPNYTTSSVVSTFNNPQMIFIAAILILLYFLFIFFQTTSHKKYFEAAGDNSSTELVVIHEDITNTEAWMSFVSLCVSLLAVIGLAKVLSPTIEKIVLSLGAPQSIVGLLIAAIVLLPESFAAVISARANRLQTSLNLALGSGIASIALTIPVVIVYTIYTGGTLTLGLEQKNMTLMMLTFAVGILTMGTGKSTLLQGAVHAVILLTYFFFTLMP